MRGLAWWPIVAATTFAAWIGQAAGKAAPATQTASSPGVESPLFRRLNAVLVAAFVVAAIALLPAWRPIDAGLRAPAGLVGLAPSGITARIRELVTPADRLFAPQPWGSWFEFAVPAAPVFVDARIELFPAAIWGDYDTVVYGRDGWQAVLDRHGVTIVVTGTGLGGSPLAERLRAGTGWREAYADRDGAIFIRST